MTRTQRIVMTLALGVILAFDPHCHADARGSHHGRNVCCYSGHWHEFHLARQSSGAWLKIFPRGIVGTPTVHTTQPRSGRLHVRGEASLRSIFPGLTNF